MSTQTDTAKQRPQRRVLRATFVAAVLAVLGTSSVLADTPASATAASAVLEATSGTSLDQLNQHQAPGYDWTLTIAFLFGVVGLVWMRRHISRL